MLNNHRQDYAIQSNDPKGDEGFGKVLGFVICFVFFLGMLQVAYETALGWYHAAINWGGETIAHIASFLPF
ncbi:hypothetical protein [Allomesorhizobium alhagi]|uniref:Uncharacterized protein n=1 Tax=Mesorhizobium alhagi CCNWXJ12-2 TaxID=1107882 RepID=H0I305_9HYPH|nr:hypothetical protein [Mesorhizobium alhagi]EHK52643.1 hypothetical protein MAXJ12_34314 [Mesorhizobium alhagi CCNWXJ12-2]